MIPFEKSGTINKEIFSWMRDQADFQTKLLGVSKGRSTRHDR